MRMSGKVGLVTAAGSGMGRAGAIRFAQEGARVAVVDVDGVAAAAVCDEIESLGGTALALTGDLRDDGFARDIVAKVVAKFGKLDFLWNHVGIPGPALVEGLDMAEWDRAIDLNLRSGMVTTIAAIPELRAAGGGSILFTASVSAITGSPLSPTYSMVKFGVVGLVRSLAKRLGPDSIRTNAVAPGSVDTPMLREFFARPDDPRRSQEDPEEYIKKRADAYPLRRIAVPDDVANAALFLLSDEASYINGVVLPVDGGLTA